VTNGHLLERVPLLHGLGSDVLDTLAGQLRRRRYGRGEAVFVLGDPGTSLCLVETGQIKLSLPSPEGREVIIDLLGPGEVFGELALLDGEPRSADAVAIEPSQLLLLHRDEFLSFLEDHPRVAINLLGSLGRRLRRDAQLLQDATFLDVPARMARTILRLAGEAHTTPRLSQSDLAGLIGTTRVTLNKWLGLFEEQGLIQREGGRIRVLDGDRLERRIY
jgi:CRP-like cAMP-binding protein